NQVACDSPLEQSGFEPLVPPPSRTVQAGINATADNERVSAEESNPHANRSRHPRSSTARPAPKNYPSADNREAGARRSDRSSRRLGRSLARRCLDRAEQERHYSAEPPSSERRNDKLRRMCSPMGAMMLSKVSAVLSAQHWADERAAGFDSPQPRL